MNARSLLIPALAGLFATGAALLAGPAVAARSEDAKVVLSEQVTDLVRLQLNNVFGDVQVVRSASNHLLVKAERSSRGGDVETVVPTVVREPGKIQICSREVRNNPEPVCRGKSDQSVKDGGEPVRVDYTISLPDGIALRVMNVSGEISIKGLRGSAVDAVNVNGDVEVETTGAVDAVTVNGSIKVMAGKAESKQKFATVNGDVEVMLPARCDCDINASTTSGRIVSELPLRRSEIGPIASAKGTLGNGGAQFNVRSVNGDLKLAQTR